MTSTAERTDDLSKYAGTWTLDPAKTTVRFRTRVMRVLPVKGTAAALSGEAQITAEGDARGTLVIDAGSFYTKNKKRDEHLRSADFLDVTTYPTISFTADNVRSIGPGCLDVHGLLTVHGRSERVNLKADVSGGDSSVSVATEFEIDRSLFGLTWAKLGSSLKNRVTIRAHFDRD
jgi:polyisoprenoid-binding protein YceI